MTVFEPVHGVPPVYVLDLVQVPVSHVVVHVPQAPQFAHTPSTEGVVYDFIIYHTCFDEY